MGITVTSTSCSGLRRILSRARQAIAVVWAKTSEMGMEVRMVRSAGRLAARPGLVPVVMLRIPRSQG